MEALWDLFYKGPNPIHEGPPLPRDPISKHHNPGDSASTYEFWEDANTLSMAAGRTRFSGDRSRLRIVFMYIQARKQNSKTSGNASA